MHRRSLFAVLASVFALLATTQPSPAARANAVVGTGTPASCTEAAFDAALLAGGRIGFDCGPSPKVIVVTAAKTVKRDTSLEGEDLIVLSGDDKVGIIRVGPGVAFELRHMTLTAGNGGPEGGGALFNDGGVVLVDHSALQDSTAVGVAGGLASRGGRVTLIDSELRGNKGPAAGAIFSTGTLDLIRSTVHDNVAAASGGAMQVYGAVTIRDSSFVMNRADEGDGGALFVAKTGRVVIDGSRFEDNRAVAENRVGGGIANSGAITITDSSLIHNYAYSGGGLRNDKGNATLIRVRLFENGAYAGGGVQNDTGTVTILDSTLDANRALLAGGGLANNGGRVSFDRVTISHNLVGDESHPGGGGGVYVGSGEALLANATLSGNRAGYGGGLFSAGGATTLGNATLIDNTSGLDGDAVFREGGILVLRNSILAVQLPKSAPTGTDGARQQSLCGGAITSLGYNLAEDGSCLLNKTGDLEQAFAALGPLEDNGGPTLTHLPRVDSPAIDSGAPSACPATDQRGQPRPYGAGCDKGAVEFVPPAPPTPISTATVLPSATATPGSTAEATTTPSTIPTTTAAAPSPTPTSPAATATVTLAPSASPAASPTAGATVHPFASATMTAVAPAGALFLPWLGQPRGAGAPAGVRARPRIDDIPGG